MTRDGTFERAKFFPFLDMQTQPNPKPLPAQNVVQARPCRVLVGFASASDGAGAVAESSSATTCGAIKAIYQEGSCCGAGESAVASNVDTVRVVPRPAVFPSLMALVGSGAVTPSVLPAEYEGEYMSGFYLYANNSITIMNVKGKTYAISKETDPKGLKPDAYVMGLLFDWDPVAKTATLIDPFASYQTADYGFQFGSRQRILKWTSSSSLYYEYKKYEDIIVPAGTDLTAVFTGLLNGDGTEGTPGTSRSSKPSLDAPFHPNSPWRAPWIRTRSA